MICAVIEGAACEPSRRGEGGKQMRTRIGDLPVPAVAAGGLAVLGGVTVRRLGIEFERAWLRSYEGPLLGESTAGGDVRRRTGDARGSVTASERRRWVSPQQARITPRATRVSRSRGD
jgi:hypothetical protein